MVTILEKLYMIIYCLRVLALAQILCHHEEKEIILANLHCSQGHSNQKLDLSG